MVNSRKIDDTNVTGRRRNRPAVAVDALRPTTRTCQLNECSGRELHLRLGRECNQITQKGNPGLERAIQLKEGPLRFERLNRVQSPAGKEHGLRKEKLKKSHQLLQRRGLLAQACAGKGGCIIWSQEKEPLAAGWPEKRVAEIAGSMLRKSVSMQNAATNRSIGRKGSGRV